jgi:hypothetical protein
VASAIGLFAGEILFRAVDGYDLSSARLLRLPTSPPRSGPAVTGAEIAKKHAERIPLAAGMKREWFDLSPPPVPRKKVNPVFERINKRYAQPLLTFELFHVYNSQFITSQICNGYFEKFPGFIFVYDPPGGSEYPRYRFPLNEVTPYGLVTNQFGWRGPPIELRKAASTVRIAFVGSSTSVNDHSFAFSYPELAGFFLDKWAQEAFGVRVEMINAGREGIVSTDIAAVVRDEVLPLEPDLVVYYEGGNQFRLGPIVRLTQDPGASPNTSVKASDRGAEYLGDVSALARRIKELLSAPGGEPSKPAYEVVWPSGVNEFDPPLDHKSLPVSLSTIIHDLDTIRDAVAKGRGELVVSSFFWLVYDGMVLDPYKHQYLYSYLNETFYPYRYRDMERLAAFQNRVLRKYAMDRGSLFMDIAGTMPREPELFADAVHARYDGVRLHAWMAAQMLAPWLRERIDSGRLPRPFGSGLQTHPAFPGNEHTLLFDCKRNNIGEATTIIQLDLSKTKSQVDAAKVEAASTLTVRIDRNARPHLYAARIPIVAQDIKTRIDAVSNNTDVPSDLWLRVQIKVTGRRARIGVLSSDEQSFLAYQTVEPTEGFTTLDVPITGTSLGPVIIAAGPVGPSETVVELRDAQIVSAPSNKIRGSMQGLLGPPQL